MPFNLPIFLTWLRIVAIPMLVAVYYLPADWLSPHERDLFAVYLFIGASFTDWADGYLARRLNQTSAFGAFLDPVADKLIVATALIVLVQLERTNAVIAAIIIGREITISALREWMAKIGAAKSVAVSMLGKVKTSAQMLAIPLLFYGRSLAGVSTLRWGELLIWVAAFLTLWSMCYYLLKAWPEIVRRTREEALKASVDGK
jgi:cardiolipin synthase (CMP-forming)